MEVTEKVGGADPPCPPSLRGEIFFVAGGAGDVDGIAAACQREGRNMGISTGDEPTWIVPRGSKPWRRYSGTFRGLVDSKYAGSLSRSNCSSAYAISASP